MSGIIDGMYIRSLVLMCWLLVELERDGSEKMDPREVQLEITPGIAIPRMNLRRSIHSENPGGGQGGGSSCRQN